MSLKLLESLYVLKLIELIIISFKAKEFVMVSPFNHITVFDEKRSHVHLPPIDQEMSVVHHLPGFLAGRTETHSVYDVVQSPLEHLKKIFSRDAFFTSRLLEIPAELALQQPIDPLKLLFLAQLGLIFGYSRARLAVLTR